MRGFRLSGRISFASIAALPLLGLMLGLGVLASQSVSPASITDPVETRIAALIGQMTLEEKVSLLGGTGFDTKPIPRLGIPSISMTDGPIGVRNGPNTAFPAGIAMGASFDPELVRDVAKAIADETRAIGKNMLLGPCVNINRHPFGGRNFESYGEDPFLSSTLAASYVRGIQGQNVLASVKHFAVNDQEHERLTVDVRVDARTLFEIHLPAFKSAVDAGSWSVMSAYNKVNGYYAAENDILLNRVLKGMWGFKGFVVSDWGGTHSTVESANNGLDLEMPTGEYFGDRLLAAVRNGQVSESVINDKVRRLLRAMFAVGLIDPSLAPKLPAPVKANSPEHKALARRVAQESAVLLKNEGALPLDENRIRTIAVLGPNSDATKTAGGGSSQVDPDPASVVTPLQGLRNRLGNRIRHVRAMGFPSFTPIPGTHLRTDLTTGEEGLKAEYFANTHLHGTPMFTRTETLLDYQYNKHNDARLKREFSVRWTGYVRSPYDGVQKLLTYSDDGVRLFIDDKEVISNWEAHSAVVDEVEISMKAGQWYKIRLEYWQGDGEASLSLGWYPPYDASFREAIEAARGADAAVIFAGLGDYMEGEGYDRPRFDFPRGQAGLIKAVARVNPNTIVVLASGNPLPMGEWMNDAKAIVQVWYPGQEGGNAIADVLLGRVNPSGKLPVTFLKRWEDSPAYGTYPGSNGRMEYEEGIFVGYRGFDARRIAPQFPFGYGLSYTTFGFASLNVTAEDPSVQNAKVAVEFTLTNTGARAGAEVAQVYVSEMSPTLARPPQELKGFQKVFLQPGESKRVRIELDRQAFAYFDTGVMKWVVNPGHFLVRVGSSSRDHKLQGTVELR